MDLAAYGERIGLPIPSRVDLATLRRLQQAHQSAIPFENLDVQLGRRVSLDPADLEAKLIRSRRGGYCFEQNTVFAHVLRACGVPVITREARVRSGATATLPRTHMTLRVALGGADWLCDVGFGAYGPIHPVPMSGEPVAQGAWTYRVADEGPLDVLQWWRNGVWEDLYAVEPGERLAVDYEMANWYTSTFPSSRFVLTLTAQRATWDVRYTLRNLIYTEDHGEASYTREIRRAELVPLLRQTFGLDVADGARFRGLDGESG
jgi:N-hydroxyarylamine O-acetyltransferase